MVTGAPRAHPGASRMQLPWCILQLPGCSCPGISWSFPDASQSSLGISRSFLMPRQKASRIRPFNVRVDSARRGSCRQVKTLARQFDRRSRFPFAILNELLKDRKKVDNLVVLSDAMLVCAAQLSVSSLCFAVRALRWAPCPPSPHNPLSLGPLSLYPLANLAAVKPHLGGPPRRRRALLRGKGGGRAQGGRPFSPPLVVWCGLFRVVQATIR